MSWKDLRAAGIGGASVGIDMPGVSSQARTSLEQARSIVDGLARDVSLQAHLLPQNWRDGWTQFLIGVWGPFYAAHHEMGHLDVLALPQLSPIYGQALAWRQSFQAYGGRPSTPLPIIPPPRNENGGGGGGSFANLMWGGLVVTGIFGVGYVLSKIPRSGGGE